METSDRLPRLRVRGAWLALLGLAVVSGLGCLGRTHWVLANLSHFRPQYAVAALLLVPLLFALSRRRGLFLLFALGVSAFNASYLAPYVLGDRAVAPASRASVSVLLWNTWRKNRDFGRVNRTIRTANADVVLLQETTDEVRAHLVDLEDAYRVFTSGDDAVLTRSAYPGQVYLVEDGGLRALHLELQIESTSVDLITTHLAAPVSAASAAQRARQLDALAAWVKGRIWPVVVLGDLNTTPWSHELQDLRSRCRLQDSLVGCGLQPTWPFHNLFTSLLRIPLDHCLTTESVVAFDRSVGDPKGSNHRPLFVRLALSDGE